MAGLKAGVLDDMPASMAEAIESALDAQLEVAGRPPLAGSGPEAEAMRQLIVAVAQGVVNHLADNPDAFVTASVDGHEHAVAAITRSGSVLP